MALLAAGDCGVRCCDVMQLCSHSVVIVLKLHTIFSVWCRPYAGPAVVAAFQLSAKTLVGFSLCAATAAAWREL